MLKTCKICASSFETKHKTLVCSIECKNVKKAQNKELDVLRKIESANRKYEGQDFPVCKICGLKAKALGSHIFRKHKLTAVEYREKFNCGSESIFSTEILKLLSEKMSGDKNIAAGHGGTLSPFSRKNKKFVNMSEEEITTEINSNVDRWIKSIPKEDRNIYVEYFTKRGMSEDEAVSALSKRQSTFNLEKCIAQLGEELGTARYNKRQAQWLKNFKKSNYSKVSQLLFKEILLKSPTLDCVFANRFSDTSNDEFTVKTDVGAFKPDFICFSKMAIIEFDGDYWHSKATANPKREQDRDEALMKKGYRILHVKEHDFVKDKETVIRKCLNFLK